MKRIGIALRFGAAALLFILILWRLGGQSEPVSPRETPDASVIRDGSNAPDDRTAPIQTVPGPVSSVDPVTYIHIYDSVTRRPISNFELAMTEDEPRPVHGWTAYETPTGTVEIPWARLKQDGVVAARAGGMDVSFHRLPHNLDGLKGEVLEIAMSPVTHTVSLSPLTSDDGVQGGSGVVEGTITVEGSPVDARIAIHVYNVADDSSWSAATHVDASGQYRIENIPPGQARLQVETTDLSGSRRQYSDSFDLRVGQHVTRDVDFAAACAVAGTITGIREGESAGILVVSGSHELRNVTEEDLYAFGATAVGEGRAGAEDGTFSIAGLEPGTYTVIALTENYQSDNVEGGRDFWYTHTVVTLEPGETEKVAFSFE